MSSGIIPETKQDLFQDIALLVGLAASFYTIYNLYHENKLTKIQLAELEAKMALKTAA